MQAVVNQTISGLACGKPIKGNVIFLGGPLNYLSALRDRFIDTLGLKDEEIIVPEDNLMLRDVDGLPIYVEHYHELNVGDYYSK